MRALLLCLLLCACRAAGTPSLPQPQALEELGSTRNARVALPRSEPRTPLVYFAAEADDGELRDLARVAPHVQVVAGLSREQALARAAEAHGVDARYATSEFLRAMRGHPAFDADQQARLKAFLEAADLVKFAAVRPGREAVDASVVRGQQFVGLDASVPLEAAA